MDTAHYYFTCQGEEKGPYRFYQLQQILTEEVLNEEHFLPEEWEQLQQFVATGQMPRRGRQKSFIRKVDDIEAPRTGVALFRTLNYVGYGTAALAVGGSLLQGDSDYLLRAEPMFYLGIYFCAAICHTFTRRFIQRYASQTGHPAWLPLAGFYLAGQLPALALIAGTAGLEFLLRHSVIGVQQIFETGTRYLAAGAIASFYLPVYYRFGHLSDEQRIRKRYSVSWALVPLLLVALLLLYLSPRVAAVHPTVATLRYELFPMSSSSSQGRLHWQFPIKIGDKKRHVERVLGTPEKVLGENYFYPPGIRIAFNVKGRVSNLHFDGLAYLGSDSSPRIVSGATPSLSGEQIASLLPSASAIYSDAQTETHVWEEGAYHFSACFWKDDVRNGDKLHPKDSLKWMEAEIAEQN
jgi:hypothetical protein